MKILFIDNTHPILKEMLEKAGFECDYIVDLTKEKLSEIISFYNGLIIRSKITLNNELLDKATNLKFVGRVGAGMESIDVEYASKKGIICFNSPEGNRDAVGEQAAGMLLSLMNNLNKADLEVKKGIWNREKNRGTEIKGKTIGIIGYGNMGSSFAKKMSGFESTIIAYDKYKTGFSNDFVKECSLEELFEKVDILSLHVPLTEETRFMVNQNFINSFKRNIVLINTARGPVIKTADLVTALKNGKITAAALDVLEYEETSFEKMDFSKLPEDFNYLITCQNVLLSPHIAGWTHESKIKLATVLAEKIIKEIK